MKSDRNLFGRCPKILALGFALVLGICSTEAAAYKKSVGGWRISQNETDCTMGTQYQGGDLVLFGWNPFTERRSFTIGNPKWDSLTKKTESSVKLFIEVNGNVEYDEWWSDSAGVFATETGTEAVTAFWEREHENNFFLSFALGSSFSVQIDGVSVGTFTLSNSKAALLELTACGAELIRKRGDPFAVE